MDSAELIAHITCPQITDSTPPYPYEKSQPYLPTRNHSYWKPNKYKLITINAVVKQLPLETDSEFNFATNRIGL